MKVADTRLKPYLDKSLNRIVIVIVIVTMDKPIRYQTMQTQAMKISLR